MRAQVYVGTYAKYNNGNLYGKWIDLTDYSDSEEFYQACKELHADEADPEFMFQDTNFDQELDVVCEKFVSECRIEPELWEAFELDEKELSQVSAVWDEYDDRLSISEALKKASDAYCGHYSSLEEYVEKMLREELSCYGIPEKRIDDIVWRYDSESMAKDLGYENYTCIDGIVYDFNA